MLGVVTKLLEAYIVFYISVGMQDRQAIPVDTANELAKNLGIIIGSDIRNKTSGTISSPTPHHKHTSAHTVFCTYCTASTHVFLCLIYILYMVIDMYIQGQTIANNINRIDCRMQQ